MDTHQIAEVLRPRFVAVFPRRFGVNRLHILRPLGVGFQENVGIVALGAPDQRFRAARAGDPNRRMRLLQRHLEGVDHPEVVMVALPAEGPRRGPGFEHQVVGFLKAFPVVQRVGVGSQAFHAGAAHEPGHQPPAGNHINLRQFLGQPDRVVKDGQRVAQQHDFGLAGGAGQDGRFQVHSGAQAGGGVVVLVEHQPVKAHLLRVLVLVQVHIVEDMPLLRVKVGVGEGEPHRLVGRVADILLGVVHIGALGETHQKHWDGLLVGGSAAP